MQLVSKRVYVWILVSCAYYKNGHVGKGHTGQQGSNKVTKHRRKDGKNDRSISMSFIKQKEKETTIVKHYSLRRPISWARSVASRSSMRHTDPRIKSIPTSHCPQTFGNTAARSRHLQDSEVHDTRRHHHHTRPDRQVDQGLIEVPNRRFGANGELQILFLCTPVSKEQKKGSIGTGDVR